MELFSCFPLCVLNTSHLMQDTGAIISVSVKLHLTEIWRHILICFSCFCVITWGLSNVTVLEQNTFRHARRTSYTFSTERELLEENQILTHFLLYLLFDLNMFSFCMSLIFESWPTGNYLYIYKYIYNITRNNVNLCILMCLKDKSLLKTWLNNLLSDNSNKNECAHQ